MRRDIDDPVFGKLKWSFLWVGNVNIKALGGNVVLHVASDDVSDAQRVAFKNLLSDQGRLRQLLERAIFDYYTEVKDVYREGLSPSRAARDVPEIADAGSIWRLLETPTVIVLETPIDKPHIAIAWNCTWDDEHGVQAVLSEGRVLHVSVIGDDG